MKIGTKVQVQLKGGHSHKGILVKVDPHFEDTYHIGILETTVPGIAIKPNRTYISVFRAKLKQLKEI